MKTQFGGGIFLGRENLEVGGCIIRRPDDSVYLVFFGVGNFGVRQAVRHLAHDQ